MARLRKFCAYRRLERPYTRVSKYRSKSYVRARPNCKIVRFVTGDSKGEYPCTLELRSEKDIQIRDNAIESARQTSNRYLTKTAGKNAFRIICRKYPHHILRENPLASGAGADRMSTGMQMSFGKVIGIAAQVRKGEPIFQVDCNKKDVPAAKEALRKASMKLPVSCRIIEVAS